MKLLNCAITVIVCLLLISQATAKSWYLSPSGNDIVSCAGGSASQPFFSWDAALKCAAPGDTVVMKGGQYTYKSVVRINKSINIVAADGEVPKILLVDLRSPFIAMGGSELISVTISNLLVSGFNVVDQNIPSSGFILNLPGAVLADVVLSGMEFRDFTAYDNYQTYQTHVIAGTYNKLSVVGCKFTSSASYNVPNTHINAAATNTLAISGNTFSQAVHVAFILDPQTKNTGGVATISGNTFMPSTASTVRINSPTMSWVIEKSLFVGKGIAGPSCSFTDSKQSIASTTLLLDQVTFDGLVSTTALTVANGCIAAVTNSTLINSSTYTLLSCSSATLSVHDTVFKGDSTEYLATCTSCEFTASGNIWDASESILTPTCAL